MKPLNLLAVIVVTLGYWAGGASLAVAAENPPAQPLPVTVREIRTQRVEAQTEVVGTVQAVQRAIIAARIIGTIEEIPVELGSQVNKGDLLVKISAGEISARLLQAQAQLAQSRRNLEREQKLLAKMATTAETVKSLADLHKVAEAAYQEAHTMLDYTKITAPFGGLITLKAANAGDLATPGTPLLQLENPAELQVVAAVPESLVLALKPGDKLTVRIPAAAQELTGTVAEVAPTADPLSRTAPVKINIERHDTVRPGQFARIAIPGSSPDAIFVPASAVQHFGQVEYCFTVRDNKAVMRLIRTGILQGDHYEILSGLQAGDTIILENASRLVDGQSISINQ